MDYSNKSITPELLRKISVEVAFIEQEYSVLAAGQIRDEIFNLLEKIGTLILYPFDEQNLWGIYVSKDDKNYFILNSTITLEKLIFAGAHELAHSLDIAKVKFEVVTANLMTEYVNHEEFGQKLEKADIIANRFAAELLVGKRQLKAKLDELPKEYDFLTKAVLLSDIFLVPYKTIVKRFIEIGVVEDENVIKQLFEAKSQDIAVIVDRFECCRRNFEVTKEKRLGGYVNKALTLYENELSTFSELKHRLELLDIVPDDYQIFDDSYDNYKYLQYAAENPDLENDSDD